MTSFLFWFLFAGVLIALAQDLKRREVDNWLTLFLFAGGSVLALTQETLSIFVVMLTLVIMLALAYLCYHGRVFAGGDAKLLFALSPLFLAFSFSEILMNIGGFLFFLLVSGAVYGFVYTVAVYGKHASEVHIYLRSKKSSLLSFPWAVLSLPFLILGFWFPFFFLFFLLVFLSPFFHSFARALEHSAFVKDVPGSSVRVGDWLARDVRVGRVLIRSSWEGLVASEVLLLSRVPRVKLKEGIPFLPAFVFAMILYLFRGALFVKFF